MSNRGPDLAGFYAVTSRTPMDVVEADGEVINLPKALYTRASTFLLQNYVASGAAGHVFLYGAGPERVALKVVVNREKECRDSAYYYADCAHLIKQRCLSDRGVPDRADDRVVYYYVVMEAMADDLFRLLRAHNLSPAAQKKVLDAVYHACVCLLDQGKIYTDLKAENVLYRLAPGAARQRVLGAADVASIKLADLGSICDPAARPAQSGAPRASAITTFPAPVDWAAFQADRQRASAGCTETQLVWHFIIFLFELYVGSNLVDAFRRKKAPDTATPHEARLLFEGLRGYLTPAFFPGIYLENVDAYLRDPRSAAGVGLRGLLAPRAPSPPAPKAREAAQPPLPALAPGSALGPYRVVRELGGGTYGSVYLVEREGRRYAAKLLKPRGAAAKAAVRSTEVGVLEALKARCAEFFSCIVETFQLGAPADARVIVLDYEPDTVTLSKFVARHRGTIPDPLLLYIMKQLAVGLYVLHAHGIVHRDIKLSNILVNLRNFRVRYIDYGLACFVADAACIKKPSGSLNYLAPEVVHPGGLAPSAYIEQADLWSLGIVCYYLALGQPPWHKFGVRPLGAPPGAAKRVTLQLLATFAEKHHSIRAPHTCNPAVRRAVDMLLRPFPKRGPLPRVVRQLNGGLARFADKKVCSPTPAQRVFLRTALAVGRADLPRRKTSKSTKRPTK